MSTKINMSKYTSNKDSGVEWLSKIPSHWYSKPFYTIGNVVSEIYNQHKELLSVYLDRGVIKFSDVAEKRTNVTSEDLSKYQSVEPGNLVLNNQQAWRGSVGVSRYSGIVSPAYIVLKLSNEVNSYFANYLFRDSTMVSHYLICSKGVGTIQRNLYWPQLKRVNVCFPPLPEQIAIAHYLDEKTTLIDKAIVIKQKQIALLKERRQIIIQQVVTRGLDPNVKMKDSGVEWIGEIPEGWEVKRLKTLLQEGRDGIRIGPFGSSIKSEILKPVGFKIYGQEHVIADDFYIGEKYIDDNDFKRLSNYELFAGDIVITMMGTTGKCKVVPDKIERGIMDSHLIRVRTKISKANPEFVSFLINDSKYIFYQIKLRSKGSIMEGLNSSIVKSLHLLLPPLNEQRSILLYVEQTNLKFAMAISLKEKEIEKLKEYKATLINSAVTGKIKVS